MRVMIEAIAKSYGAVKVEFIKQLRARDQKYHAENNLAPENGGKHLRKV
ncbi:hypothetical protein BVRB_4g073380 [Beta vulgaris subsp. vulgaris]|nr:hypothetical protein BVRB_4g073380 [Beta vulgaris subsp. vulgaris]